MDNHGGAKWFEEHLHYLGLKERNGGRVDVLLFPKEEEVVHGLSDNGDIQRSTIEVRRCKEGA